MSGEDEHRGGRPRQLDRGLVDLERQHRLLGLTTWLWPKGRLGAPATTVGGPAVTGPGGRREDRWLTCAS